MRRSLRKTKMTAPDQSVESSSPAPASTVTLKQEPEDHLDRKGVPVLTVLKIIPSGFISTMVYRNTTDQSVESSLQGKMSSPVSASTVSIKQEPGDNLDTRKGVPVLTVLKIIPSGFISTMVYRSTTDQSVESSLQGKMSSPVSASTVSIKQEPGDNLDINFLHFLVCKEEVSPKRQEMSPSLVLEESETLLAVKGEDDENRETEPLASTSAKHMETKTEADEEDCVASQHTSDDHLLSSHCSESDITEDSADWASHVSQSDTEDSDEWAETTEDQSTLNTLKSHNTNEKGQRLSLRNKLSQHLKSSKQTTSARSHTVKKIFSCTVCGQGFTCKGNLKEHARIHTGEKPFTCKVCAQGFGRMCHLNRHMRSHTGEKPFTCTVCENSFTRRGNFDVHMRSHRGEKPFTCTVCKKSFNQNENLQAHMKTHTGEKPFCCTVCGKAVAQMRDLKVHMRIHTGEKPFTCTECGTSFNRHATLKRHMRIHTGETPFTCTVCEKSFSRRFTLTTHMQTHTPKNHFTCTVCKRTFTQIAYFRRHMSTHTGEK